MQFIVVIDGRIVGQIYWDGLTELDLPPGTAILTVAQATELRLDY